MNSDALTSPVDRRLGAACAWQTRRRHASSAKSTLNVTASLGVLFWLSCMALSAQQGTGTKMQLDIASQPLESALHEFSVQSGIQLLFSSDRDPMHRPAPAVIGMHTADGALRCLLANTGLKYEYVNSRTVAISEKRVVSVDGYVVFEDAALIDVVSEFNNHTQRKIFIADPALATFRLSGNFRTDNVTAFLRLLENGFPITIKETEDSVTLTRSQ